MCFKKYSKLISQCFLFRGSHNPQETEFINKGTVIKMKHLQVILLKGTVWLKSVWF